MPLDLSKIDWQTLVIELARVVWQYAVKPLLPLLAGVGGGVAYTACC